MGSYYGITPGRVPTGKGNGLPLKGQVKITPKTKLPKAPKKSR